MIINKVPDDCLFWKDISITLVPPIKHKHDDVIKWKHFPRYWPFVWVIHRSPVNSPHKGQWRAALIFSLICTWLKDWVNSREAGDLRHRRSLYDVTVMQKWLFSGLPLWQIWQNMNFVDGYSNLSPRWTNPVVQSKFNASLKPFVFFQMGVAF